MPAKKDNSNNADDIFNNSAAPADKPTPPADKPTPPADAAAFDQAIGATPPAASSGIDFAAASEALRAKREAEAARQDSGDNTPIDINSGEAVTTGFFMDLTKDDDFELIPAGTRLVVSCTAAEAVVSSAGNPMINVRVKSERVVNAADMSKAAWYRNRSIRDRLMFIPPNETTGSRGTIWRAKLAFKAFGVEFDARAFRTQADFLAWLTEKAELMIGAVCEVVVGVDDGTQGGTKAAQVDPKTGEPYPPKNTIANYYAYNPSTPAATASAEDLPF
jgi:hypothetical protein